MPRRHTALHNLWLVSDARNDGALEAALKRLPRGSGFIFRHYHLPEHQRRARFDVLRRIARAKDHIVILAGDPRLARKWGADGFYSSARRGAPGRSIMRLVAVHSARELAEAGNVDAVLLSPLFPTRSHPGAKALGPVRWRLLARLARIPVIALGGMTSRRASAAGIGRWAAIDGLASPQRIAGNPQDS
jgi:thiamine-phosphate pyrophosphorylase